MADGAPEKNQRQARPPLSQLWQVPAVLAGILVFLVAAYIARHPVETPSSRAADFTALKMSYESGDVLGAVSSAEKFLSRHPGGESEAFGRFVLAYGKWSLAKSNPAATRAELVECLGLFRTAQILGLPPAYDVRVLQAQGDLFLRLDLAGDAIDAYTSLLDRYPSERKALLQLSKAYAQRRPPDVEKARDAVTRYLAIEDLAPEESQNGYLAKARMELSAEEYVSSISSARKVLESGAQGEVAAEAALLVYQALSKQGDFPAAVAALDEVDFASAGRLEAAINLAKSLGLWNSKQADEARLALEDIVWRFPGTTEALSAMYYLSRIFLESGQIDAAKDSLLNLLDEMSAQQVVETPDFTIGDVTDLWFEAGRKILEARDYAAVRDFHGAATALMSQGHFLFFDGTLYLREAEQQESVLSGLPSQQAEALRGRIKRLYHDAGAAFVRALDTASGSLYSHSLFSAGHAFLLAGDYTFAERLLKDFSLANVKDDRVPQANYERALSLAALGNYQSAVEACRNNARDFPSNIFAYKSVLLQGDLQFRMGGENLKAAAETYGGILTDGRFLATSHEWRRAIFALGRTLYLLGDYRGAMLRLDEALQRFPDDAETTEARYYFGLASRQAAFSDASIRESSLRGAAAMFSQLASQESAYTAAASFLEADCYYDLGECEKALLLYDRAVETHVDTPEATRALFQMANCYHRMGQMKQADATYKRALFNLNRKPGAPAPGGEYYRSLAAWRSEGEAQI